jgi:hypothetical protein
MVSDTVGAGYRIKTGSSLAGMTNQIASLAWGWLG